MPLSRSFLTIPSLHLLYPRISSRLAPTMDNLSPSDSISQTQRPRVYGAAPYPTAIYQQQYQPLVPHPQAQQYYLPSGAQGHAQRYHPNSQPTGSQEYDQSFPRSRRRSRRHSSFVSSSTIPGNLASRYVPTSSYCGSGSTLMVPSNAPYPEQYGSTMGTPYSVQQSQMLQGPNWTYPHPASPYGTHSAPTSPTTTSYSMQAEALPQYSPHSIHSPRSQHSDDLSRGHSSYSSHSHLSAHSHQSSHSHSYQPPHASLNYSSQPLVPRHALPVSSHSHRSSHAHARSHSYQSSQASPTPGPSSEAVVLLPNVAIRVISSAPGPGPLVVVNVPQQTEQRKSSLFGSLANLLGRKSRRRDSY